MKLFTSRFGILVAVLAIVCIQSGLSHAGLLPVSDTITPDGANFRYSYGVVLTSDSTLKTGDFFTIYDFQGMVSNSNLQPAGFTFSSSAVGPTPPGTAPVDSPTVANATWTYTGPDTIAGSVGLGNFMVGSLYGNSTTGQFAATTQRQVDGMSDSNITETKVPVPAGPSVPEPASLALFGIGLPLVGLYRYFRRGK